MVYETRANYDDEVFILKNNKLIKSTVMSIIVKQYTIDKIIIEYKLKASDGNVFPELFDESRVFLTKEALVDDLIKDETIEELT